MPAGFEHGSFHLGNGVGWTARKRSKPSVEHGQIVEMISGGQNRGTINLKHPAHLRQRRSLVVMAVAEPEVNRVSLEGKILRPGALLSDERHDLFHNHLAGRDKADRAAVLLDDIYVRGTFGIGADAGDHVFSSLKKQIMPLVAKLIPFGMWHPIAILASGKNFPFIGQKKIRFDRGGKQRKAFQRVIEAPARVHHPKSACIAVTSEDVRK